MIREKYNSAYSLPKWTNQARINTVRWLKILLRAWNGYERSVPSPISPSTTESRNWEAARDLWKLSSPTPLARKGQWEQAAQGCVWTGVMPRMEKPQPLSLGKLSVALPSLDLPFPHAFRNGFQENLLHPFPRHHDESGWPVVCWILLLPFLKVGVQGLPLKPLELHTQ